MKCRLRDVSTTYQERYQSSDGRVIVERVMGGAGRGAWLVLRRGKEAYVTGTKAKAFDAACKRR